MCGNVGLPNSTPTWFPDMQAGQRDAIAQQYTMAVMPELFTSFELRGLVPPVSQMTVSNRLMLAQYGLAPYVDAPNSGTHPLPPGTLASGMGPTGELLTDAVARFALPPSFLSYGY